MNMSQKLIDHEGLGESCTGTRLLARSVIWISLTDSTKIRDKNNCNLLNCFLTFCSLFV